MYDAFRHLTHYMVLSRSILIPACINGVCRLPLNSLIHAHAHMYTEVPSEPQELEADYWNMVAIIPQLIKR